MQYYIDFTAHSNRELSALYLHLHRIFAKNANRYAVSFPDYVPAHSGEEFTPTIGRRIRLFATNKEHLSRDALNLTVLLLDHSIAITPMANTPKDIDLYANFSRAKRTTQSHLRRLASRAVTAKTAESIEQAMSRLSEVNTTSPHPYVAMYSASSKNSFPLHVKVSASLKPVQGEFCSYGLGRSGATVPIF